MKEETFEVLNLPTLSEEKKKGNSRCSPGGKIHPGLKLRVSGVKKMMRVDC